MYRSVSVAVVLLLLPLRTAWADNWASTAADDKAYAASKALCQKARDVKLPASPAGASKDCHSSALLYGIGRPADPTAARACAAREMKEDADDPAAGAATLATIYANGTGAPRDYEIAIAYACRINGARAEMDERIKHLAKLKADGPGTAPFDICDDATSGLMEGFCARRDGDLANARRTVEIAKLTDGLGGAGRTAFDRLQKEEAAFVKASSEHEVDLSGTARGAMVVGSQQAHDTAFVGLLRAVLAGKITAKEPAAEADTRLNATYGEVMAVKDTSDFGTVHKTDIKATQRVWIAYRDAFLAFVKTAAPTVSADAVAAKLTDERTKDLAAFLEG